MHPIYYRLRTEIDAVVDEAEVHFEDLSKLSYTSSVSTSGCVRLATSHQAYIIVVCKRIHVVIDNWLNDNDS